MRQSLVTATLLINFKKPYEIFLVRADGGEATVEKPRGN